VKSLADTLSSIGQPLHDSGFTGSILNGLDKDYDSLIENITGREVPISPQDLLRRLLNTEQRVEAHKSAGVYDTVDHSANASYRGVEAALLHSPAFWWSVGLGATIAEPPACPILLQQHGWQDPCLVLPLLWC
jgi:hypothetical protein